MSFTVGILISITYKNSLHTAVTPSYEEYSSQILDMLLYSTSSIQPYPFQEQYTSPSMYQHSLGHHDRGWSPPRTVESHAAHRWTTRNTSAHGLSSTTKPACYSSCTSCRAEYNCDASGYQGLARVPREILASDGRSPSRKHHGREASALRSLV